MFLVHAHGEKLNDRLSHAQTSFQFVNRGSRTLYGKQDVSAIVELADGVSEATLAHALDVLHGPTSGADLGLQGRKEFFQILVGHIRPNDKHDFISTHFISPFANLNRVTRILPSD